MRKQSLKDTKGLFTFYRQMEEFDREKEAKVLSAKITKKNKIIEKFNTQLTKNQQEYKNFMKNIIKSNPKSVKADPKSVVCVEDKFKSLQAQLVTNKSEKEGAKLQLKNIEISCDSPKAERGLQEFPKRKLHINHVHCETRRRQEQSQVNNPKASNNYKTFIQKIRLLEIKDKKNLLEKHHSYFDSPLTLEVDSPSQHYKFDKNRIKLIGSQEKIALSKPWDSRLPNISKPKEKKHKTEESYKPEQKNRPEKRSRPIFVSPNENSQLQIGLLKIPNQSPKESQHIYHQIHDESPAKYYRYKVHDKHKAEQLISKVDIGVKYSHKSRQQSTVLPRKLIRSKLDEYQ